ncbi:MAG: cysteine desulfurase family protein [Rhodobacteraceae bacterium]|nr:cysteine desulfurase family protein [Paracoccaceae bacterium]
MQRAYLDWNATAPIRDSARQAMADAFEIVGNPSSTHAEGRAARALIESAREALATACGTPGGKVIFTSGATEAAAWILSRTRLSSAPIEHPAVLKWTDPVWQPDTQGRVRVDAPETATLQLANGETGVIQELPQGIRVTDATQAFGKIPIASAIAKADIAILSAHKLGGPKGVGAVILKDGVDLEALHKGGGQEYGLRSGTENLSGIAGFGAAARSAREELSRGIWEQVAEMRDRLESMLREECDEVVVFGHGTARLPNTSCFAVPGWKAETQVMQLDLNGFAVSAGSACTSGKTRTSGVLPAMGVPDALAGSAIRVSIGERTTIDEIDRFVQAWSEQRKRFSRRNRVGTEPVTQEAA